MPDPQSKQAAAPPPPDPRPDWRAERLQDEFRDFGSELRATRAELSVAQEDSAARIAASQAAMTEKLAASQAAVEASIVMQFGAVRAELAELRDKVGQLPTTWLMLTALFGFAVIGAAVVYSIAQVLGRG